MSNAKQAQRCAETTACHQIKAGAISKTEEVAQVAICNNSRFNRYNKFPTSI
jgi:hypothetical protein